MSDYKDKEAWRKLCEPVTQDVEDYWESFQQPVMLSRLGKRQNRLLKECGLSMVSACREIAKDGFVTIFITEAMARYLLPKHVRQKMTDEEFMVWKAQFEKKNLNMETKIETSENLPTGGYFNEANKEEKYDF